jgi:hypothetical protein
MKVNFYYPFLCHSSEYKVAFGLSNHGSNLEYVVKPNGIKKSVITVFVHNIITWQNQQLHQDTITHAMNVELLLKRWKI